MSHNRKLTDDELIKLFKEYGSPDKIAKVTGMNVRSIYRAPQKIEDKFGIELLIVRGPSVPRLSEHELRLPGKHSQETRLHLYGWCDYGGL
jgi:hypothetical protein